MASENPPSAVLHLRNVPQGEGITNSWKSSLFFLFHTFRCLYWRAQKPPLSLWNHCWESYHESRGESQNVFLFLHDALGGVVVNTSHPIFSSFLEIEPIWTNLNVFQAKGQALVEMNDVSAATVSGPPSFAFCIWFLQLAHIVCIVRSRGS